MTLDEFVEFLTDRTGFLIAGATLLDDGKVSVIFETDDEVSEIF